MATVTLNTIKNTDITSNSVKVLGTMSYTNNSSQSEKANYVDILVNEAINTRIEVNENSASFNTQTITVSNTANQVNIQLKLYYDVQEYQVIQTEYYFKWGYVDSTEPHLVGPTPILDALAYAYFQYANNPNQYWVEPAGFGWPNTVYYAGAYFYKSETKDWVTTQQNASVVSEKQTIYLRPNKFYFLGDNTQSLSSYKERIKIYINNKDKGLKSALPNIYRFNEVATQWKRWKNQSTVADCSAFQKGQNLSKEMMNKAAAYIGANIGDSTLGPLKLTKKMFAALENKLNE